jgi:hypothetical protein
MVECEIQSEEPSAWGSIVRRAGGGQNGVQAASPPQASRAIMGNCTHNASTSGCASTSRFKAFPATTRRGLAETKRNGLSCSMGRSRNPRGRGHLPLSKDPVKGIGESLPTLTAEQAGLCNKVVGVETAFMLRPQRLPSIDGSISATGDFASMPCFQTPRRLVALLTSAVRLKRPTLPNLRGKERSSNPFDDGILRRRFLQIHSCYVCDCLRRRCPEKTGRR